MPSPLVSAAFFAAAVAASVVSAGCPSNIPNFEANIVQVYNGNRGDYKWMFGLTTPTDAAPAGFSPCGETAYISQYDTNSKDCSMTINNKVSAKGNSESCLLTYKDAIRQATVDLTCDETASAPRMNGEVTVQQVANEYHYAFKGAFSGVCGPDPSPNPGPDPSPRPDPSPNPDEEDREEGGLDGNNDTGLIVGVCLGIAGAFALIGGAAFFAIRNNASRDTHYHTHYHMNAENS